MPTLKNKTAKEVNDTCLTCHEKANQASFLSSMHARRNVACTTCHSIHSYKSDKAQLKTKTDSETCFTCHKTERAKSLRTSHHPVREGKMSCSSCHNPHDGVRRKMIKADSNNELCFTCHAEKRGPFLFEHAPVREDCVTCHDAHGSNHARMVNQKLPNLCWNCHLTGSGHFGSGDNFSTEKGVPVAHSTDWLGFRVHVDGDTRKVRGVEAGSLAAVQGVMEDHAERDRTRIGADVELTPSDKYGVTFAYNRRQDDYPNRPFKVAGDSSTESGLLEASYDMFSVDFDYTPTPRAVLAAFYTYEKTIQTTQWVTLTSGALNNRLTYVPSDKGNTFGLNGVFQLVPDKWPLTLLAQQQKVDGLWDITAREAGTFYTPGRTTLIPTGQGGAADVIDWDDIKQTTAVIDLGYAFAKTWTFRAGYAFDKYTTANAFSVGTTIFPQSVLFFLKANDGGYTAHMCYTRLSYRF